MSELGHFLCPSGPSMLRIPSLWDTIYSHTGLCRKLRRNHWRQGWLGGRQQAAGSFLPADVSCGGCCRQRLPVDVDSSASGWAAAIKAGRLPVSSQTRLIQPRSSISSQHCASAEPAWSLPATSAIVAPLEPAQQQWPPHRWTSPSPWSLHSSSQPLQQQVRI